MARGSSPLTRGKHALSIRVRRALGLIPAHAGKTGQRLAWCLVWWAHPRSRGENAFRRRKRQHTRGSSPLTRGKRPRAQPLHASQRLIPAHAGKTPRRHRVAASLPAHPRSRGENGRCSLSFSLLRGSSPLTRGKRGLVVACEVGARLIPAHAGKTPYGTTPHLQSGAHPRSRGENFVVVEELPDGVGSSPLTRGKRSVTVPVNITARLIPAHAGKTLFPPFRSATRAAHPRSRGENVQVTGAALDPKGSSPLTRGKQAVDWRGGSARGLIPAHAGKTEAGRWSACRCRAHPRSRGENDGQAAHHCVRAGSSPLTRGKRDVGQHVTFLSGLIPAHAGKTWTWPGRNPRPTAHPRSRGENCCMARLMFSAPGSSPLTRGKLLERFWNAMLRGLIPAHAGKTLVRTHVTMRESAHPRSRGENSPREARGGGVAGSSPLTRGKLVFAVQFGDAGRLIPAHAGKTLFDVSTGKQRRAHPRSRGENTCQAGLPQNSRGSSPLTRGKLHARDQGPCHPGLIPAHAGKTPRRPPTRPPPAAHPRSRGENRRSRPSHLRRRGSSPLTRGKPSSGRHPT